MNKKLLLFLVFGLFVGLAGLAGWYFSWITSGATAPGGEFNADRAYADVVTQVDIGPRIPGSEGHAAFILWAADEFGRMDTAAV